LYGTVNGLTGAVDQRWDQDSTGVLRDASNDDTSGSLWEDHGSSLLLTRGFGTALAIGDFNGDGIDDLAIGVPGEDVDGISNAGAVNVLYGSAGGLRSVDDQLWQQGTAGIAGAPGE
jgi:hypothetical protein